MAYAEPDLTALKLAVPLWRVAQDRLPDLKKVGAEYKAKCPFHSETTASFTIRNKGEWMYHCFGCGANGNVFQFIENYDKVSFVEAVEKVKSLANWQKGKTDVETTFQPCVNKDDPKVVIPLEKLKVAEQALVESSDAQKWLDSRGISLSTAQKFHLGFVQSAKAVNSHHPWVDQGWIIFPTIEQNQIVSLKYRSVQGKKTPDGTPGFLRKSGMATTIFNLEAVQPFDDVFITEGEPDCMVLSQAGYTAVCLPSASFTPTPEMRDRIIQANAIYLAGDMDNAGQEAMTKLWTEFRERTYLIKWPDNCKDANETFLKVCHGCDTEFRELVETLKSKAKEQPMPFVYDMKETMRSNTYVKPFDDPARLYFPWTTIDSRVNVLPGDVMYMFASETKCGKSTWLMNILLENAIKHGKVIVNYSAELLPAQYAQRAVSYLTFKDREQLNQQDFLDAAEAMGDARFYNGYKPGANWKDVIELLKWAKRRIGADILVVDPISFLIRGEKVFQEQGEAMRAFKDLALEYKVIVIVVGQPRKAGNNQRGREALGQDSSGSYAQSTDASQVFILHRDRLPSSNADGEPIFDPVTKVKLEYGRDSNSFSTKLLFKGNICRFGLHTDEVSS